MTATAPEFVFENLGSHGDIMPLLAIAAELVRRGHSCVLLANEHFRDEAHARGVAFHATSDKRTLDEQGRGIVACTYTGFERVSEYFRSPGAFDARTVLVNTNALSASEPLAEMYRLRAVRLHLFPIRIRSLIAPPWPLGARARGPDGERFLERVLPAMYRAADSHPEVLARINACRAELKLGPVHSVNHERPHLVAEAAMFPDWYGMPAEDWPDLPLLGFPLPRSPEPLPARVLEFLACHPRPLVFTTGTGFGKPAPFFAAAAQCSAELGMPGIFLSRFLQVDGRELGEHIAHFDHVELEALLPHAAALVHHGGLGTTARALQAGTPQVISPVTFDQPDNGHRVEVLGVGRVVARDAMSGATFAAALRELLAAQGLGARLARYRAALGAQRGVENAADLLQSVARGVAVSGAAAPALASLACEVNNPLP